MVRSEKKHRIIFIDLIRALAVIQMVQGHTIDALLAPEYRSLDYPVYYLWNFMRGITAPVFMFSAGTVFTYLFRL
ncbi:MAG: heparan-alpha-glucosaminide N-acetyltransferase domain-containing protein, partial [Ignavibacteriaceae bacterium]|nr:heparan-alpha-glucosaminide N-acetyltransferase domain-containing protein [Ignavibacteriaceae bacterium]